MQQEMDLYYSWILESELESKYKLRVSTDDMKGMRRYRNSVGSLTRSSFDFVKLTTWRPSSAYKEVPVPPPKMAKNGERWRLALSGSSSSSSSGSTLARLTISLDLNTSQKYIGQVQRSSGSIPSPEPFAVLSMPISFRSNSKHNASSSHGHGKQEEIERLFSFKLYADHEDPGGESSLDEIDSELFFVIREKLSFDLDKVCQNLLYNLPC